MSSVHFSEIMQTAVEIRAPLTPRLPPLTPGRDNSHVFVLPPDTHGCLVSVPLQTNGKPFYLECTFFFFRLTWIRCFKSLINEQHFNYRFFRVCVKDEHLMSDKAVNADSAALWSSCLQVHSAGMKGLPSACISWEIIWWTWQACTFQIASLVAHRQLAKVSEQKTKQKKK